MPIAPPVPPRIIDKGLLDGEAFFAGTNREKRT
jgi:hypothetical protein